MAKQLPADYRPPLFGALYRLSVFKYKSESDYPSVIEALNSAGKLNPSSPLPNFYLGKLNIATIFGSPFSMLGAKCIDVVVPRTADCVKLDEVRRLAVRAWNQLDALKTDITAFLDERPYTLQVKFNGQTQRLTVQVHVQKSPDPMWSIRIGEIIHNFRSALDHIVWELVGRPPLAPTRLVTQSIRCTCPERRTHLTSHCRRAFRVRRRHGMVGADSQSG
jgi:hypothetical protein